MLIEVLKRGLGFFVGRFRLLNGNPRRNCISRIDLLALVFAASRLSHPGLLSRLPCCRGWCLLLQSRDLRLQLRNPGRSGLRCLVGLASFRTQARQQLFQSFNLRTQLVLADLRSM